MPPLGKFKSSLKTVYVRKGNDIIQVISKGCGAMSWKVTKAHLLKLGASLYDMMQILQGMKILC